ncbi:MAG TPA: hypothetical protein VED40_11240 [Azospirillaceae bacterium]|nr:hypothetical protein [Azospirillaceae bacterium]
MPTLSAGQVWSGPPIDGLAPDAWRNDPEVARLAGMAASRAVPADKLEAELQGFAGAAGSTERLTLLFGGIFHSVQAERTRAMEAIRRFARSQRALADRIAGHVALLETLPPDDPGRAAAAEAMHWDRRLLEDRARLLPVLCDSPVMLERRLGAAARLLAARLE